MMNRKTLGLLAAALVVLGVLSWVTTQRRYAPVEGGGFVPLVESLDNGAIAGVTAWLGDDPEGAVELQRSGDDWIVASSWGWPAKEDQVDRLLDDLDGLEGELRSSSADVLDEYEITGPKALHIVAKGTGGSELAHLVVGKTAMRGGCFVRVDGSDDVYLTAASLRSTFGVWGDDPQPPAGKRWIDLRVFRAERNDVDRATLKDGKRTLVLEKVFAAAPAPASPADSAGADDAAAEPAVDRTQWTWKPDAAGPFDKGKTDGIVSSLCNLYANDVVEPGDLARYGLETPARVAELTFADGTVTRIFFGDPTPDDGKLVYFRVGETGDPATIHASTVDRIFLDRSELKPAEG